MLWCNNKSHTYNCGSRAGMLHDISAYVQDTDSNYSDHGRMDNKSLLRLISWGEEAGVLKVCSCFLTRCHTCGLAHGATMAGFWVTHLCQLLTRSAASGQLAR